MPISLLKFTDLAGQATKALGCRIQWQQRVFPPQATLALGLGPCHWLARAKPCLTSLWAFFFFLLLKIPSLVLFFSLLQAHGAPPASAMPHQVGDRTLILALQRCRQSHCTTAGTPLWAFRYSLDHFPFAFNIMSCVCCLQPRILTDPPGVTKL